MKKKLIWLLAAGLAAAGLAGCGGEQGSAGSQTGESKDQGQIAESQEDAGELVLYSPAPEDILNMLIQEFQDKTGVKVELIQAGSGELFARIKSESANPLGDVIFGGGAEAAESYKEYLEPYTSPEAAAVREEYKSADGSWTGAYVSPTIIMYNKNLVTEHEVPGGWADFVDAKWKGKVAFADPVSSGSSFTTLSIMLSAMDQGDGGWNYIRSYVDTLDGNILNSSSAPHKGVADGEYSMCVTQEQAVLQYTAAGADHIGIVYPEEGTGAIPSTVAVIKGAPNEENAKKFVDFVLSSDAQKKFPEHLHHLVRADLEEEGDFAPLGEIRMADFDFLKAAANKDAYIKQWNDIVMGK